MPTSLHHEVLVELLRRRPELVTELLGSELGIDLHDPTAEGVTLRVEDSDIPKLLDPAHRADLVIVLYDAADRAILGVIVEVQLSRDDDKRYAWPLYAALLRNRHRCPTMVLVVTADLDLANRLRRPIETGPPMLEKGANRFAPVVLGPDEIPPIHDVHEACNAPYRGALSALAHAADIDAVVAGLVATEVLDPEPRAFIYDMILGVIDAATRARVEQRMNTEGYKYKSEPFREAYAEGRTEGRAEGRAAGEAAGEARAVLAVLDARGIEVSEEIATRVRAESDLQRLEAWLRVAVRCADARELFERVP